MRIETFTGGPFVENGYVAVCEASGATVVIDPGGGAADMVSFLESEGLGLDAILLTHAHLDHVDGLPIVLEHASAPIYLHPNDRELYDAAPAQGEAFGVFVPELPPPDREWAHGDTFTFGDCSFAVSHTPGHAPGHVILYAADQGIAFVGDVVFAGSIGRTDLPGGNYEHLFKSIREHVLTLPDETRLLTGHGPPTTVGHERVSNPFLIPHYGGELA